MSYVGLKITLNMTTSVLGRNLLIHKIFVTKGHKIWRFLRQQVVFEADIL